jgi:NAD+ synthetase
MKIGVAQIDTTVGDFQGNVLRIRDAYRRAAVLGADLVLFPELAVSGYPPMDFLERPAFVQANLDALDAVAGFVDGPDAVVGFAQPNTSGRGKPLFNAAAFVSQGRVLAVHRKALLPTYDVFDEERYFEASTKPTVVARPYGRIGVTICEDIWNDPGMASGGTRYVGDPVVDLQDLLPDVVVNVSASPFFARKIMTRLALARRLACRLGVPVVYANQVGGNDGLVFDGESFVVARDGKLLHIAKAFGEDLFVVDLAAANAPEVPDSALERSPGSEVLGALSLGIRDFCGKLSISSVVVGVSGGIDSAVVAALAVNALGPSAVTGISMPSPYSSEGTRADAATLCRNLGIAFHEIPIEPLFQAFLSALEPVFGGRPGGLTEENLQARIRGMLLMAWSNRTGAIVLNTGNKSELAVGYSTLYGDMVGGLAVIGDLNKALVYDVARELNLINGAAIPEAVISRPPSAELRPDQKDEDSLPPYPVLDPLLDAMILDNLDGRGLVARGFARETVSWVTRTVPAAEFKRRQAPISLKVTPKAFGVGRRYPIVQRFREDLG